MPAVDIVGDINGTIILDVIVWWISPGVLIFDLAKEKQSPGVLIFDLAKGKRSNR